MNIEKNIPIWRKSEREGKLKQIRTTLSQMKPGDSFLYNGTNFCIFRAAQQLNISITTRKVSGEGYRVWRV